MIELISIYIKKIAVYMIFTYFINIFLPDSKFKSHIYFVLGIIIIITVVSPLSGSIKLSDYTFDVEKKQVESQIKYYETSQRETVLEIFNSDMEKKILEEYPSIKTAEVISEIQEDSLYIKSISCRGTSSSVVDEISKTYDIPKENVHYSGVDTNGY